MKKTIILGVTGSIAAYKMANVASMLVKKGFDVHVLLSKNGAEFITATTFETITNNKCITETFDRDFQFDVTHISLAKKADLLLVAPASANIIGKLVHGIADDMLSTTALACTCPKLFAPAMNTAMYQNQIVQKNIAELEEFGWTCIKPSSGRLACGDTGEGKLPPEEVLVEHIESTLCGTADLKGKKILITAGATQEKLDPVRYITNHSTGKMGYALAEACVKRGGEVILVSGKTTLQPIAQATFLPVTSAQEMFEAVTSVEDWDIVIKAAAVADYRPIQVSDEKIKKNDSVMEIKLEKTLDILQYLGEHRKQGQFICGFSMETENMIENSKKKLKRKNIDMIVANNLKQSGAGFGGDTNIVTIITNDKEISLELLSKRQVADKILDEIVAQL